MSKGTRRADVKNRLSPRRMVWPRWLGHRVFVFGRAVLVLGIVGALGLWAFKRGYVGDAGAWAWGHVAQVAAGHGFVLDDVLVEGRHYLDAGTLREVMDVAPGEALLGIDLPDMQARIEALPWVMEARVRRVLPNKLKVRLVERLPVALWLDAPYGPAIIDDMGVVLTRSDVKRFGQLLAVEGAGAPREAGALMALLKGQPDIAVRVQKGVRISERRWDLVLDAGQGKHVVLRLSEDDPGYALARAARAQAQEQVLDQGLKAIDLRQSERIILEGVPGDKRDLLLKGGLGDAV